MYMYALNVCLKNDIKLKFFWEVHLSNSNSFKNSHQCRAGSTWVKVKYGKLAIDM